MASIPFFITNMTVFELFKTDSITVIFWCNNGYRKDIGNFMTDEGQHRYRSFYDWGHNRNILLNIYAQKIIGYYRNI